MASAGLCHHHKPWPVHRHRYPGNQTSDHQRKCNEGHQKPHTCLAPQGGSLSLRLQAYRSPLDGTLPFGKTLHHSLHRCIAPCIWFQDRRRLLSCSSDHRRSSHSLSQARRYPHSAGSLRHTRRLLYRPCGRWQGRLSWHKWLDNPWHTGYNGC